MISLTNKLSYGMIVNCLDSLFIASGVYVKLTMYICFPCKTLAISDYQYNVLCPKPASISLKVTFLDSVSIGCMIMYTQMKMSLLTNDYLRVTVRSNIFERRC